MRNSAPAWVLAALSASLSVSLSAPSFADAPKGAPSAPPSAAPPSSAPQGGAAHSGGGSAGPGQGVIRKIFHTIPEDGSGSVDDIPASSRLVRDIIKMHPKEDLIICIAGCRPGGERVVYAQPSDPQVAPKPAPVSEAPPLPEQPAAAAADAAASEPAKTSEEVKPVNSGSDASQAAATGAPVAPETAGSTKSEMVPTSADAHNPAGAPAASSAPEETPPKPAYSPEKIIERNPGEK